MVNKGLITWLPTLYKEDFHLAPQTGLVCGLVIGAVGVVSSVLCALLIDRVGRKRWRSSPRCSRSSMRTSGFVEWVLGDCSASTVGSREALGILAGIWIAAGCGGS
ncbi:hypothetical protein [Sinomonas atrocyanea]